jgi:hypothetical protein
MQRFYPNDIFPSLWEKLATVIDSGLVVSCDEVYDELDAGDDSLIAWAKARKKAFLKSEADTQLNVRYI